jgi:pyridoxal phosphate enzyme (YggS family)
MNSTYTAIKSYLEQHKVTLVAVSKTRPIDQLQALYDAGQRDFGENRVQEMRDKQSVLPADIRWHQIGHLQRNKVKYIAPWVHLIHSVDSLELLEEINHQAAKSNRVIPCLLQMYIAREETKFGLDADELHALLQSEEFRAFRHVQVVGLMGMATQTTDTAQIRQEFMGLHHLFQEIQSKYFAQDPQFTILSMGMSSDYEIAVESGATMVRIGSLLFN